MVGAAGRPPPHKQDLLELCRVSAGRGPKLFVALSACPSGWGVEPADSVEIARLAVESGVWPLKEWQGEAVVHTVVPHRFRPVEEYLARQGRYRHLFEPQRQEEILRALQADVDRYWAAVAA